jgi:acetyl esterase/lipase
MSTLQRALATAVVAAALWAGGAPLVAHQAARYHVHGGASLPPDFESFAVVWYPDIPYATAPDTDPHLLSLDIHLADANPPAGDKQAAPANAPVVVYVHGGGGVRGDKAFSRDLGSKPVYFIKREGYIFVSVNYRLGDAGRYPVAQQDVADAVAWVHSHIAEYGGDPNRIVLLGHSSGSGLAARVATIDRFLAKAGKDRTIIKGVITLDGGNFDGLAGSDTDQGRQRMAATYGPNRSDWEAASPLHNVGKNRYVPPFLIAHIGNATSRTGSLGGVEADAVAMAAALKTGGHEVRLVEFVGKDHNQTTADLGLPGDPTTAAVHRFLSTLDPKKPSAN